MYILYLSQLHCNFSTAAISYHYLIYITAYSFQSSSSISVTALGCFLYITCSAFYLIFPVLLLLLLLTSLIFPIFISYLFFHHYIFSVFCNLCFLVFFKIFLPILCTFILIINLLSVSPHILQFLLLSLYFGSIFHFALSIPHFASRHCSSASLYTVKTNNILYSIFINVFIFERFSYKILHILL